MEHSPAAQLHNRRKPTGSIFRVGANGHPCSVIPKTRAAPNARRRNDHDLPQFEGKASKGIVHSNGNMVGYWPPRPERDPLSEDDNTGAQRRPPAFASSRSGRHDGVGKVISLETPTA